MLGQEIALLRIVRAGIKSGQNQAVRQEGLKISGVAGRQFRPATNGYRRNHAIRETAGTASRLVEQAGRQHGIGGQKGFGGREDLSRDGFGRGIQRPAQKFRPWKGRS
jgi:hypothetical protein